MDININGDDCDYNIQHDIDITKRGVKISSSDEVVFRITRDNELYINGDEIDLTRKQEALVEDMADEYRELVPNIAHIAVEGAELGIKAATLVITAMAGHDPELTQDFVHRLDNISNKLHDHVSENKFEGEWFNSHFQDSELEQEIEQLMEDAVSKIAVQGVWNIVKQALSGDEEEAADLEFRMEMLEHEIEDELERDAEGIEQRAMMLCQNLETLDNIEQRLASSLAAFEDINIVEMND
nr:DUF2884 family protein [Pleionea sp. CnH1-48]